MEWKRFKGESCPKCGDELEVFTACDEKNDTDFDTWYYDGDAVKCAAGCGFKSVISVDEHARAYVMD
jgi:hypothetical protein